MPKLAREVCRTPHRQKDPEAIRPVHTTAASPHDSTPNEIRRHR
jgi:hypothetical protein